MARFVAVGIGANLILLVISYLLRTAGLPAFVAGAAGYATAFAFAYTAQRTWTFASEESHARLLPRYLAAQAACAILSGVAGHVSVEAFSASPLAMSLVVTLTAGAASYLLSSRWVFHGRGKRP